MGDPSRAMEAAVGKTFLYTEVQASVPFEHFDWERANGAIKDAPGLIRKTWLSGLGTNTIGGVYQFDSAGHALAFAAGPLAEEVAPAGPSPGAAARIGAPPVAAGDPGRAAVVVDPVGAPVSLWQPGTQTGMQAAREHGTFAAIELLTGRPDEASDFYHRVLGWRTGGSERTHDGQQRIEITGPGPPPPTGQPSLWLVNFASSDIDTTVKTAPRLGATRADLRSRAAPVRRGPAR